MMSSIPYYDAATRLLRCWRCWRCALWMIVPVLVLSVWTAHAANASPTTTPSSNAPTILVLGDSLSAEYGLTRDTGWVALLAQRLSSSHPDYRIVNASVSGETTSGGVTRLPALLAAHKPRIVILELGGNDALRGLPLDLAEQNLTTMTRAVQAAGAQVLIVGMQIPPNYGRAYAERFRLLFKTVAQTHGAAQVPFLLAGFAEDASYFQPDRIHPNAAAQPLMRDHVWHALAPLL